MFAARRRTMQPCSKVTQEDVDSAEAELADLRAENTKLSQEVHPTAESLVCLQKFADIQLNILDVLRTHQPRVSTAKASRPFLLP